MAMGLLSMANVHMANRAQMICIHDFNKSIQCKQWDYIQEIVTGATCGKSNTGELDLTCFSAESSENQTVK